MKTQKKKLFKNYKKAKNKKIKVLNFVPKMNLNKLNYLDKKKYELKKSYLYIPNQFWPHKNHEILIKCARELKIKIIIFNLLCQEIIQLKKDIMIH